MFLILDSLTDYTDCSDDDPTFKPIEEPGSDFEGDSNPEMENVCDMSAANIKENVSSNSLEMSVNSTINTCDVENLIVGVSKATGGNEKFNVCKFCNKKQKKIARHLETVHKDEEEVKKFKDLPKGSTERLKVIGILRKQGNFNYNTKVSVNDGNLIVSRRPNAKKKREAKHYLPCAKCKGFYSRNSLRVHFRICAGISSMRTRYVTVMGKKIVARLHHIASKTVREKLFPPLREDEPVRLIRYDELVILYANKMCEKYRNERYFEMIRQRIRLIGRFLMIIKTFNNEIQHLETVFDPKYCKDVIRSINKLAGSNETGHFENPTVASSLASLLKYISKILISECIVNHDDVKRKNAKNFLALLTQEIDINITRTVTESQVQLRRQKAVELPSTSDIKAFYSYLKDKSEEAFQKLSDSFSRNTWCKLAEVTLLSVQIFNRRRPGELERILIEDFNRYESINVFDEDLQLSEQNKETAKRYVRFLIRGKLNRTVPVILDKRQVRSIELLLKFRKHAKIAENNPYIFAAPGVKSTRYLRACNLIRKYASLCGAQHPERLRGTKLRKHIATTCLKLNLEEEQVKELANFMGHDVSIHKNIYRQPLVTHDILRMSKLLEAAQGREDEMENSSDESNEERVEQTTENPEKRSRKPINRTENKEKGAAKKKRSSKLGLICHCLC